MNSMENRSFSVMLKTRASEGASDRHPSQLRFYFNCSFSCTNATIKKFRDALAKHGPDRCSLGRTKGLEEKELVALAANKDLNFTYRPKHVPVEKEAATPNLNPSLPSFRLILSKAFRRECTA
ncbi:hypothetical protein ARALYDRAFT_345747 [Arabidopsis lyrata subsp. lyrata]|uniref:Uncharacterized protein n=1 Tax=Arabidopsis lyrata subsp. lyrata TaxID=81972 RepID=D7LDQ8_ARALL|nr:hypothetical protein ARALYDRAFT_345747 [Arabidopsis lyrata subsp. lyrata]